MHTISSLPLLTTIYLYLSIYINYQFEGIVLMIINVITMENNIYPTVIKISMKKYYVP